MSKLLVVSYSGFSDSNANGKTLKALLSKWRSDELAQFYCGSEKEDVDFCNTFFHVTDKQMLQSFYKKKKSRVIYATSSQKTVDNHNSSEASNSALPSKLRRFNYNFLLRTIREYLWIVSPWGKKEYKKWVDEISPTSIFYMVGESWFLDRLVMKTAKRCNIPIILYNCEAFRIVNPKDRKGLDRYYYKKVEKSYRKLLNASSRVIYNSDFLKDAYQEKYDINQDSITIHNSSSFDTTPYKETNNELRITYFGNLGVGRVPSLIRTADILNEVSPELHIDVYGKALNADDEESLRNHPSINFFGHVSPEKLIEIKESSDILLHVESFDESIVFKLRYAFSTKIAQYLCAGRSVVTFAPAETASTKYLLKERAALVATNDKELREHLVRIINDPSLRLEMADKAINCARKNHDIDLSGYVVREFVERG